MSHVQSAVAVAAPPRPSPVDEVVDPNEGRPGQRIQARVQVRFDLKWAQEFRGNVGKSSWCWLDQCRFLSLPQSQQNVKGLLELASCMPNLNHQLRN